MEKIIDVNSQLEFKLIDVGGQRNERRKWFSLFEGVGLVIFLVSMSDFNKLCYEDDETNRMVENYNLFKETVNNKWFKDTPFVILFNKMDVFKEKLKAGQKINAAFPEYDGGEDAEDATKTLFDLLKGELNIIGWQEKGQVQKEIENKIMRFLKTKLERDEAKSKAKEMLDVLIKNKDA